MHLDGLRGLACVMVLLSHYVFAFYESMANGLPAQSHGWADVAISHTVLFLFYSPHTGVAIFFVLSGYVLAASLAGGAGGIGMFLALSIRRWVRLFLPVALLTPICYLALHAGAFAEVRQAAAVTKSTWLVVFYPPYYEYYSLPTYYGDLFRMLWSPYQNRLMFIIGTLWTLPIEFRGSLGVFAVYCFSFGLLRYRSVRVVLGLLAMAVTWRTPYYGFGLGCALFELRRSVYFQARFAAPAGAMALLAGLWLGGTPFADTGWHLWVIDKFNQAGIPIGVNELQTAGAFLVVLAAVIFAPFQRLLRMPLCQYLGRISFMLYLVQNPVICALPLWVFLHLDGGYNARALAALAVYVLCSVILADIFTRVIDRPSIWLSQAIFRRLHNDFFSKIKAAVAGWAARRRNPSVL